MIVGIGTDILEVARMKHELQRQGARSKTELFTPAEIAYCEGKRYPARHYAARFSAKEALFKALAARAPGQAAWREAEVTLGPGGEPRLLLHGALRETVEEMGVTSTRVSLTHTAEMAAACCLLES
jgi:holo-[acyl-carrier protein] synthase